MSVSRVKTHVSKVENEGERIPGAGVRPRVTVVTARQREDFRDHTGDAEANGSLGEHIVYEKKCESRDVAKGRIRTCGTSRSQVSVCYSECGEARAPDSERLRVRSTENKGAMQDERLP